MEMAAIKEGVVSVCVLYGTPSVLNQFTSGNGGHLQKAKAEQRRKGQRQLLRPIVHPTLVTKK
jgi:hypothetical protein